MFHADSAGIARLFAVVSAGMLILSAAPEALAQSQSGFTYNGMAFVSYQPSEYLNSSAAAQDIKATGANYTSVVVTQYVQNGNSTTIAPETTSTPGYSSNDPLTPTDAAVVAAIQNLQAQGITVTLKPHVDSLDGTWRGNFTWPSSDTTTAEQQAWLTAWFTSYEAFILHYAQIASANNVSVLVIGNEFVDLSGSNCAGANCRTYWDNYVINPIRASYPDLTLTYGANATGSGDEFTTVTFWNDVDILGVEGYFDLTDLSDPTVSQLVSAWTNSPANGGFNAEQALANLSSAYNKPLIFAEVGYESTPGSNEQPWNYSLSSGYDPTEQADCYEAFFEVYSAQASWMKGVFWWDWLVSPPTADDPGYTPQNKPAGDTVLLEWYGAATAGFTLAPSSSTLSLGHGLSATDTISVTELGGFTGTVTLAATGLPSGVTAAFSAGTSAGTQVLTLKATSSATTGGPVTVTVTGTSGALTQTTTIALTVIAPVAQVITFNNPGTQLEGTQLTLGATTTSGLPVSYSTTASGICTVSSATATAALLQSGTCTISAAQAGNGIYAAASTVTQSFQVTALTPVPVPASADVITSQVNWLAALSVSGYALVSANPDGGSFGVNSIGEIAFADTNNVVLYNSETGAATTLGAWMDASTVAIDSQNNLYIGNLFSLTNGIVKLPYTGGTTNGGYAPFTAPTASLAACTASSTTECALPVNVGGVNPGSMAFDTNGTLYWVTATDGAIGSNGIWKCTAACLNGVGSSVEIYEEPAASQAPSSSSGQLLIGGLAIDTAGNLFFTDSSVYVDPTSSAVTSFYSDVDELPASTGLGYGGNVTGYTASPVVLYTLTPSSVGPYDDEVDGVAVSRNATGGDKVYFADQGNGVFAFPDTAGGIPLTSGQPSALYMVSLQGAKALTVDGQGNLYVAAYSTLVNTSGADTLAQVLVDHVTVPASPIGTAVSPSATLNPVTTILNDTACAGIPTPQVTFVASASTTATATMSTSGSCSATFSGGSAFTTAVSFTPTVVGPDSVTLTGTDQAGKAGSVTVTGVGTGFILSPTAPSLTVPQGGKTTDTITVNDEGGFSGAVTLAASGLPSGVTASFAINPATSSSVLTLTATNTATAGGPVTVTITGTSGTLTATTTIALTVSTTPIFTLSPQTPNLTVVRGSSNTDTIAVTALNRFSAGVTFTASGLPSGVTASFSPNPASGSSSVLTLMAGSTATTGSGTVTITGTAGTLTETTTIALTVNAAPSFMLAPSLGTLSVNQGGSNTDSITVTPANGFTGGVTLVASGLPSGVTASFSPNPASGSSVLTLTASKTATTGQATVTITGTSGGLTETTTFTLTVNLLASFTLYPWPTGISIAQGSSGSNTITLTETSGFAGSVTLVATGLPSGVTASFSPNPTTNSSMMTLTASSTAVLGGPVTVTITGTSGTQTASTTIAVTVDSPPSFTLSASPGSVTVGQGGSGTSTITVTGKNQFAGAVTMSASGLPSGVTASFAPNLTGDYSVVTFTASSTATAGGPVSVTITGTSGSLNATTDLALTVNAPPAFLLSALPTALTVSQGSSVTSTISVTDLGGFVGNVALTASGLPSCVTASFASGASPGTQVLTLTAASGAAAAGPVAVTISGTSGSLTAFTTVAVTVTTPPGFTFSGSALTINPGATSGNTATISVTPSNGFTGTINLSCMVEPQSAVDPATCSLSPTSLTFSGATSLSATLTVYTTAATTAENRTRKLLWPSAGGAALALLLFFWVPGRRRNWPAMLGLLVVLTSIGAMGCVSGSTNSSGNQGTAAGTYVVTVKGTSGTITESGQISLTVQ